MVEIDPPTDTAASFGSPADRQLNYPWRSSWFQFSEPQGPATNQPNLNITRILLASRNWQSLIAALVEVLRLEKLPVCGATLQNFNPMEETFETLEAWQAEGKIFPAQSSQPTGGAQCLKAPTLGFAYPCACCGDFRPDIISAVCLPLRPSTEISGLLHIYFSPGNPLSASQISLLTSITPAVTATAERFLLLAAVESSLPVDERRLDSGSQQIARDLHDTLGHTLASLLKKVEELSEHRTEFIGREAPQLIEQVLDLTFQANEQLRSTLADLYEGRGLRVQQDNLFDEIRNSMQAYLVPQKIAIQTRSEGTPRWLPARKKTLILFFIREALRNIGRHSQASTASVHLVWERSALLVEIKDNGVGFNLESGRARPGRLGLSILEDCATALGGRCFIHSGQGAGTLVRLEIPFASSTQKSIHSGLEKR